MIVENFKVLVNLQVFNKGTKLLFILNPVALLQNQGHNHWLYIPEYEPEGSNVSSRLP